MKEIFYIHTLGLYLQLLQIVFFWSEQVFGTCVLKFNFYLFRNI